jgi:hypothetical protein
VFFSTDFSLLPLAPGQEPTVISNTNFKSAKAAMALFVSAQLPLQVHVLDHEAAARAPQCQRLPDAGG